MDKKTTGIVAYITWIGWLIAFFAGDKEGAKFHLNQSLVLWLASIVLGVAINILLVFIPIAGLIGSLVYIFLFVCWIIGLINACKEEEKPLPLIGGITLLK